nr:uncharacterized protein LOC111418045 [Onthophagus taurus]
MDSADIKASRSFANILQSFNYDFEITDLSTKINKLHNKDHILLFYLHHHDDPFSSDFCVFLQNREIEEAFRKNRLVLYAWDISNADQVDELILSFAKYFDDHMIDYFLTNKSVAFGIVSYDRKPFIFKEVYTPPDLVSLRELLLKTEHAKPPTSYDFLKSMEKIMNVDEYTSYEREDHDELKANIKYALYGPPIDVEEEIKNKSSKEEKNIRDSIKKQDEAVEEMFRKILETNNKYCKWNGRVVLKMIYVCLETLPKEKEKKAKRFAKEKKDYDPDSDYVPYPVFILRKCKRKTDPCKVACRIIIDTEGRVYESWSAFLDNNKYPPGEIIYPKDGRYVADDDGRSTIYCSKLSPACNPLQQIAGVTDVAAGVSGVVAGGVSIAGTSAAVVGAVPFLAAAAPIALPIAAFVGIGSGLYAVGRSINSLVDRKKHKQEIDLKNAESRAAFLNIAGGVFSVGMFGAMRTVSFLAGRGFQLGTGTRFVLYGLNGVNLTIGGMGIGNAIYQAISSKTKSPLVIVQLGASILFFSHSVYTFKNIGTIIEESQNQSLSEIELSLRSNRHRRTFNKMLKESIRTQGESQGKASVISSIRNTKNVDEVIAVLTRSNKMFNKEGIRFSAVGDQILLNGRPVDMMNFGSMARSDQTTFLETFPPIPENLTPNVRSRIADDVQNWAGGLKNIVSMGELFLNRNINQIVDEILSAFEKVTRDYIFKITKRLFNKIDPLVLHCLVDGITNRFIKLLKWACNQLRNNKLFQKVFNKGTSTEHLSESEIDTIVNNLENDLYSSYINYEYDSEINNMRKQQRRSGNPTKTKVMCDCGGYYYN